MSVAELLLVRHGESTANLERDRAEAAGAEVIEVEARDADVRLSDRGVQQARNLGRYLRQGADALPSAVWSSPYVRARQTAQEIMAAAELSVPLTVDERLRDKELGILDTLTTHGVRVRYPMEAQRRRWLGKFYYRAPGGESWADLALRLRSVLLDLERTCDGGRIMLVTHDAVITVLRYICEAMDEEQVLTLARSEPVVNAGVTRLARVADGSWRLRGANEQHHLLPAFAGSDLRTEHGRSVGAADGSVQA